MSVLDIVIWPDARLTQICQPVDAITPEIERLTPLITNADFAITVFAGFREDGASIEYKTQFAHDSQNET